MEESYTTHCAEQVFYFDADGVLRRHDYISDVIGWSPAAHYTSGYREFLDRQSPMYLD